MAEAPLEELQAALEVASDQINELQASLDSVTQTHLEEQQRWGIERERLVRQHKAEIEGYKESVGFWTTESLSWADRFGTYRQTAERRIAILEKAARSWRLCWFIMLAVSALWAVAWAIK